MTITPSGATLSTEVIVSDYATQTWLFDPGTGQLAGNADGIEAVAQMVDITLNTERFYWQIYSPNFGMERNGLLGLDEAFLVNEIQRRISEALHVDSRVKDVTDFAFLKENDVMIVSFTVVTVFGDISTEVKV